MKFKRFLHVLICFGLAWMITNGWAYIMLGLGLWLDIKWMYSVATGYLAFLWLPCTPEKIITIPICLWFNRIFFKDKWLENWFKDKLQKVKDKLKKDTNK